MPDYQQLISICDEGNRISSSVIDDFLVYYSAHRDKTDREFEDRIERYRSTAKKLLSSWIGSAKAQYITHRIFKKDGLIHKYLPNQDLQTRDARELNFLKQISALPWRFSFSVIKANPAPDFYEMEDVFSGESYLLYSPGISRTLSDHPVMLWFIMIAFNGSCWITYGPITGFQCFGPDDIFFYATELNKSIESDEELMEEVEKNPVPYMMLISGSTQPLVIHRDHEVILVKGEAPLDGFDFDALKTDFRIEFDSSIFKLSHKILAEFPHFAEAYIDEEGGTLHAYAMTDYGYQELVRCLNSYGFNLSDDPDIRIHLPMLNVIRNLLKKEINLNPFSKLFEVKKSPDEDEFLKKLNQLLALAIPYINAGIKPDAEALAKELEMDPETVKNLLDQVLNRMNKP